MAERLKQLYLGGEPDEPPVVYAHQLSYLVTAYGLESEVVKEYVRLCTIKVPQIFRL